MAELFGKDRTVIGKHIKNAIEEGEIDPKVVCANFAHITRHGSWRGSDTYYTIRNKVIPGNIINPAKIEVGMAIWMK